VLECVANQGKPNNYEISFVLSTKTVTQEPNFLHMRTVFGIPQDIPAVLEWLSHQASVYWLAPRMATKLHNLITSSSIQGGRPVASAKEATTAAAASGGGGGSGSAEQLPMWAAGLTGQGQIVGLGDSGVDVDSCYFWDPQVRSFARWVESTFRNTWWV
jgi:hypothetical protein